MERRQVRFRGRVQGVGFRATARHLAAGFTVTGWVRNEADGSVLMEVQGAATEIDAFLGRLRAWGRGHIVGEQSAAVALREGEAGFEVER